MIPYATCMCPGRRYRSWTVVGPGSQVHGNAVIQRLPGNSLCIKMADSEREQDKQQEDKEMSIMAGPLKITLFQTLHKRRPKHPIITPRTYRLSLIDTCYNRTTDRLLSHSDEWAFNTFNLDIATGGRSLSVLLVHLFQSYGLVETFKLDMVKVWKCFSIMEATYHSHNPYHNSVHAADVAQAMHCFLKEKKISAHLTPTEAMSALIAAVGHDLDHPGVNQPFLVATSNHLVQLYQCSSVLENHHWRIAISCLKESGIFNHLEKNIWDDIQWQVRSLILATDITRQQKFLAKFKIHLENQTLDMMKEDNRHFTLQIALKCADLCNPCRPWLISQRWSHQVCQEFYRQGDYERQLNLPTTPTFDRNRTTIAKIQADFFKFIVTPLFETWHSFLDSPLSSQLVFNLHYNHCQWKKRVEREKDETIPVAGLVIPHTIDIPSPHDNRDLLVPETLMESEIPITRHPCDTSDLETPTEELNPTTSVMSLSNQKNVLKLKRVRVISQVETYFFKRTRDRKESREKCINGCCTPPDSPVNKTEEPTDKPTTTWCWHISRSLSEERPQQPSKDFDSPAHSWKGSVNNLVPNRIRYRRGSAPMVIGRKYAQCPSDMTEICGGLRGGGRRWSIPSEPISGTLNITGLKISKDTNKHNSYGLLESHIAITSTECQKEGKNKGLRKSHKLENDGKSILLMGSPIVFSCVAPTGRRGSLPTDLPISLMQTDTKIEKITKQEQWDHNRRRSAGEILSVLFGSAGTLTTIQSLDSTSKSVVSYRRRGSDGLELLYGFWRSRRGDYSGQVFAGRYKLPLSLDTSNIPDWSPKREDLRQFCTNYLFSTGQGGNSGISTFNEHICQRRASVPISVSSLTANSGSPYRSYQDRMS